MEKMFSFTKCTVVQEGSIVYQKGEQVLRTIIDSEDPERHTKLARTACNLLNKWYDGAARDKMSGGKKSVDFDQKWLDALLIRALDHDKLSSDNQSFARDMKDRLDKYGDRTFISPAQMSYLEVLGDKMDGKF